MSSSSEGRYEIEAAKHRLISAKKQASVASKNMESAKVMTSDAKSNLESAKAMMESAMAMMERAKDSVKSSSEEVDAAEKFLAAAEKRWEVIDIADDVDDSSPKKDETSDKRTKVSLSPQRPDVGSSNGVGGVTSTAYNRSNSNNNAGVGGQYQYNMNMNTAVAAQHHSGVANSIIVEGCGMHDANGVYIRSQTHSSNGFPIFHKRGDYLATGLDFHIVICNDVRQGPNHYLSWCIGMVGFPLYLYQSNLEPSWVVGQDPSKCSSWVSTPVGIYPPPQVKRG